MNNIKLVLLVSGLLFLAACQYIPDSVIPVKSQRYQIAPENKQLIIFIPGIADDEYTFESQGLLKQLREHDTNTDVISAHVHLGYVLDESFIERVRLDLVQPARQRGYQHIWIVGVSLGAFVAVNYFKAFPNDLEGMLLLGPYLGDGSEINMIRQAGGIERWRPNTISSLSKTLEFWHWYQQRAEQRDFKNIYLGYGTQDHLIDGIEQFRQLLPAENVKMLEGGHDWTVWSKLWGQFLEAGVFN